MLKILFQPISNVNISKRLNCIFKCGNINQCEIRTSSLSPALGLIKDMLFELILTQLNHCNHLSRFLTLFLFTPQRLN